MVISSIPEDKLKRLYKMVETALPSATTSASPVSSSAATGPPTAVGPAGVERFGRAGRENITPGETPFRRAYLLAVIDRIEADDGVVRIIGR